VQKNGILVPVVPGTMFILGLGSVVNCPKRPILHGSVRQHKLQNFSQEADSFSGVLVPVPYLVLVRGTRYLVPVPVPAKVVVPGTRVPDTVEQALLMSHF